MSWSVTASLAVSERWSRTSAMSSSSSSAPQSARESCGRGTPVGVHGFGVGTSDERKSQLMTTTTPPTDYAKFFIEYPKTEASAAAD